jgi:hypothetical protein
LLERNQADNCFEAREHVRVEEVANELTTSVNIFCESMRKHEASVNKEVQVMQIGSTWIFQKLVLSDGTRRFALPTLRARAVALPRAN